LNFLDITWVFKPYIPSGIDYSDAFVFR